MTLRWGGLIAAAFFMLLALPLAQADTVTLWHPADLSRASFNVTDILPSAAPPRPTVAFAEQLVLHTGSNTLNVSVNVSGLDYRISVPMNGAVYTMGRSAGRRWRQTPAGTVRIIYSDVQGDDLDRWPETVFGFDPAACSGSWQTADDHVLECRPTGDDTHWFYVSKNSGRIEREVSREGSRVVTFTFSDYRDSAIGKLPYHWTTAGNGGNADVSIASIQQTAQADVSLPAGSGEVFHLPDGVASVQIPAKFEQGRITIPFTINGKTIHAPLDTGTTQMLVDGHAASGTGLRSFLGHAIVRDARIGDLTAAALPVETTDIFGGELSGLVGNEFFVGHIVHIDYAREHVDVIRTSAFTPPADAFAVPMNCDEGMPLISLGIGGASRDRVAIDTGSQDIVLAATYFSGPNASRFTPAPGGLDLMHFVEGQLLVRLSGTGSVTFGPFSMDNAAVRIVVPDRQNLDLPLDGLIATNELGHFELWFDYDHGKLWMSPYQGG